jgi:hypothetical protein
MSATTLSPVITDLERTALGTRVYCDDVVGLDWSVCSSDPDHHASSRINVRNEGLLRALATLEEHHDEPGAEDGERAEIRRLEGKLDLVLELLCDLLRERNAGSAPVPARFSAEGLCWHTDRVLAPGTLLLTDWFVQPAWPVALRVYARIVGQEQRGDHYLSCARLEGLSDAVVDGLDKLVFRRHRRTVARSRHARSEDSPPAG